MKNFALFCLFDPMYIFLLYTLLHIGVYGAYNLFIFNNFLYLENIFDLLISQLTFTCSNSPIETLEKGVKYVQN